MTHFTATALAERAREFKQIFGSATVPILSAEKVTRELIGADGALVECVCFLVDLRALPEREYERLVEHLSATLRAHANLITAALRVTGFPIPAADCTLMLFEPGK